MPRCQNSPTLKKKKRYITEQFISNLYELDRLIQL